MTDAENSRDRRGIEARDSIRTGLFFAIAAVFFFSISNALIKWLVARYPIGEVVFFRSIFSLLPALVVVASQGGWTSLRTQRLPGHLLRSIVQFGSMAAIFMAFSMMPLAEAVAITFASPLFLTVLAIPMLGEKVGLHRAGAVLAGFAGVLIMVRPGADIFGSGAPYALANAALGAYLGIMIRQMARTETGSSLVFYNVAFGAIFSLFLLPLGWVTPSWSDAIPLVGLGLVSGFAQFLWVRSAQLAPASVAAPFGYMHMIWAMLFGFLVWGDLPDLPLIVGSVIVAASGLYIMHRETGKKAGT
jgi:drug/metabolite transporter (DMT)-like permease